MKMLRRFVSLGALVILCAAGRENSTDRPGLILVADIKGDVRIQDSSTAALRLLSTDDNIHQSAMITTASNDSRAVLVCSNGTVVRLASDTVLRIEAFTQMPFASIIKVDEVITEPSVSNMKLVLVRGELAGRTPRLRKEEGSVFLISIDGKEFDLAGSVFRISRTPAGETHAEITPRIFTSAGDQEMRRQRSSGKKG